MWLSEIIGKGGRIGLRRGQRASHSFKPLRTRSPDTRITATTTMVTSLDTFRFRPQIPEFIPYKGPPKIKPVRRRIRQNASPIFDEWADIDRILGIIEQSKAASERKAPLAPAIRAPNLGVCWFQVCFPRQLLSRLYPANV